MTTILIKKKDTAGAPAPGDLTNAAGGTEIAVNTATKRIYTKDSSGTVVELGTNATSSTVADLTVTNTLTVSGTVTSNLKFTDNTYDIGASGATRPRTGYFGTSIITPLIDATNVEATNIKALDGTAAITIANSTGVVSFTANPILSGGTAAGVLYLNGSKVVTSGAALSFNGTTLTIDAGATSQAAELRSSAANGVYMSFVNTSTAIGDIGSSANMYSGGSAGDFGINSRSGSLTFSQNNTYRGRFDTSGNLLVNLSTALANGKLQVAGSIGLSGNTEIRQATNSDGNTLRLLATQVVVGATNAISYNYSGSALLASFSNAGSAAVLEVGGNIAGHRFTITNDGTGQSGSLNYTNVGGTRFYVNSLTGYAGFGTSSPADQVSITTVDGGNTAAKLRLTGSNAGGIINFYNAALPTGQIVFDQSGNLQISQSLGFGSTVIYPTLLIDTSQQLYMKNATTAFPEIKALKASGFGYSPSSYGALIIGSPTGNVTPCFNVDPIANTGGSFSGTGQELVFRNGAQFIQPNSGNTNFNPIFTFDTAGNGMYMWKSLGLGGTTPSSSGAGITFPATQSASSNVNTLDDYEEGTWSPVVSADSGASSGGSSVGFYTKVGRMVYLTGAFTSFAKNTLSGPLKITGLPFTPADSANSNVPIRYQIASAPAGTVMIMAEVEPTGLFIQCFSTTGYLGGLDASHLGASGNSFYSFTTVYNTST